MNKEKKRKEKQVKWKTASNNKYGRQETDIFNIEKPGIKAVWMVLGAQSMNMICSDRNTNKQYTYRYFSSIQASQTGKLKHCTILQVASI